MKAKVSKRVLKWIFLLYTKEYGEPVSLDISFSTKELAEKYIIAQGWNPNCYFVEEIPLVLKDEGV